MTNAMKRLLRNIADEERPSLALPLIEAQLDELAICVREDREKDVFEIGDRVEYKHARGPVKAEMKAKLAFIFWRYLDDTPQDNSRVQDADDAYMKTSSRLDCLIACIGHTGVLVFDVADSHAIRKIGKVGAVS